MELLKRLNDSFSACGYEEEVRAVVSDYLSKWYAVSGDTFGNVIATKAGEGQHLAFAAPMDTGGLFLNYEKSAGCYHYVKLSTNVKTNLQNALGRTFDGHKGVFLHHSEEPDQSYLDLGGEPIMLPMVADITVPFAVYGNRVVSRQGALFALLKLAEKLAGCSCAITIAALAQTSLQHRGACGKLPSDADFYTLIEPMEEGRFHMGDGGVLCLKDGVYLMPESLKERFSAFENRCVCECKPSLAATLSKQQGGLRVASVKLPVRGMGTVTETFCPTDIDDLCGKLAALV